MNRLLILSAMVALGVTMMAATAPTPAAPRAGGGGGRAPAGPPAGISRVKLWEKTPGGVAGTETDANPMDPTIDIYLPPADKATGAAVMVLPGGGYSNLSMANEGSSIAQMFLSHNVAAFVVRYRHGPTYHNPYPLMDAQRAIRTVRSKADEYHIDAKRLGVIGFSAGGHLAACLATMYPDDLAATPVAPDAIDKLSARPDFALLLYPVIDMTDDTVTHKPSRTQLTQDDKTLYEKLSPQLHVTKDTPPIFLAQATRDGTVPVMNSILFYEACLKAKVPVEMHLFQVGGHGFGLGGNDPTLKLWPEFAINWLTANKVLPK